MDRPGVHEGKVPEVRGKLGKMEETGCKIIKGTPMTLAHKGQMTMMMKMNLYLFVQRQKFVPYI